MSYIKHVEEEGNNKNSKTIDIDKKAEKFYDFAYTGASMGGGGKANEGRVRRENLPHLGTSEKFRSIDVYKKEVAGPLISLR